MVKKLFVAPIKAYRFLISPLFGNVCRYYPSCSEYACQAIDRFGVIRGSWMGVKRVLRCNPWFEGGYDPCPAKK